MLGNRLGVLTDEVSVVLEEALDWIAAQGLSHVELRVINGRNIADLEDHEVREVRSQVEKRGLYISAVASPLFKCRLDASRTVSSGDTFGQKEESVEAHFRKLDRVIEIALMLGAPRIRIFSFWRELQPELYSKEIASHLKKAAERAERSDVVLLLENEPSCNAGFAEEVADIVERVDSQALRGLWDPGNEAYGGREAYPRGYEKIKGAIGHVHLKDAYIGADGLPRCVPLGSGDVPVIAQLKALEEDGYEGLYTIETHFIPAGGSQMTGTRMTLDALRALLGEVRR
ncbi:sugar phosphate isomerase/epimerase family protein [Paenibacillus nasutitermitis]|uniref:Xylose isomerase-like TIM barrel domain-containing protein n=1 Tax=Paenibacillus nasutitermitis TaxID=1652958 RepID=A0A917DQE0_9BACL|nr:sugar phosphate isomerase/epimerase family protein [Paenibacillus nasutitermitis]GGD56732.1 hypothetical protein GCM10010911_13070 [Paenibacillus nasutitermitis]